MWKVVDPFFLLEPAGCRVGVTGGVVGKSGGLSSDLQFVLSHVEDSDDLVLLDL